VPSNPQRKGNALCHRDTDANRQHNASPYTAEFPCAGLGRYLEPGAIVVTRGNERLRPGMQVTFAPPAE
jgi:hypothetical protein